jgi:hypothetical protein
MIRVIPDGGDEIGGRWVPIFKFAGAYSPSRSNGRGSNSLPRPPLSHRKES